MSHYPVAVFMSDDKQSIDSLLAPYDEELEVTPYKDDDGTPTTYNPNSKWDWYQIGGRWQGRVILKDKKKGIRGTPGYGTEMSKGYDGAFVRDIDFEAMQQRDLAELEPYEKAMKFSFVEEKYMRELYPTEEEYVKLESLFNTFAVITPDGEWHMQWEQGWWDPSPEHASAKRSWHLDYYDRFIKPALENNWYMTIVDCHI